MEGGEDGGNFPQQLRSRELSLSCSPKSTPFLGGRNLLLPDFLPAAGSPGDCLQVRPAGPPHPHTHTPELVLGGCQLVSATRSYLFVSPVGTGALSLQVDQSKGPSRAIPVAAFSRLGPEDSYYQGVTFAVAASSSWSQRPGGPGSVTQPLPVHLW